MNRESRVPSREYRNLPRLALCAVVFLVAGCNQWEGRDSGDLVKDTGPAKDIGPAGIVIGPVRTVIGVEGPDPEFELFGTITDIEVDANANVYVIDKWDKRVRVFDQDGSFLGAAGQEGDGPGEFRGWMRVAPDTDGRIHVMDARRMRLYTLELTDSGLAFTDEVQLEFQPQDMCAVQGRRFLLVAPLSDQTGLLIREVDARGRVVNAFGEREKLRAIQRDGRLGLLRELRVARVRR